MLVAQFVLVNVVVAVLMKHLDDSNKEAQEDAEMDAFLFSLGCYSGEPITVISRRRAGCTVSIKDARYSIDKHLAAAIEVE